MQIVDFKTSEYGEQITALWIEAFGDTPEYIERFFNAFEGEVKQCLLTDGEKLLSMASLLPCRLKINNQEFSIVYLYAMCTDKARQGQGNGLKLLKDIEAYCKAEGFDGIALLPAEDSLIEFYKKAGYESFFTNYPKNDNAVVYSEKYLKYLEIIGINTNKNIPGGMLLRFNKEIDLDSRPYMAYPMN